MAWERFSREKIIISHKEAMYCEKEYFTETNKAWVSGEIDEELKFSHNLLGESFYKTKIKTKRLNETYDLIPMIISTKMFKPKELKVGQFVEVGGSLQSHINRNSHVDTYLHPTIINIIDNREYEDAIYLNGFICRKPYFKATFYGKMLTSLYIAVHRPDGKSDYISCLAWGSNADIAYDLSIGDEIMLYGRIQSRQYFKKNATNPQMVDSKMTYEVSITNLKIC